MVTLLQDMVSEISAILDKVEEGQLERILTYIDKDTRIFLAGNGRSGLIARGFAIRLVQLGYTVYVTGETIVPQMKKGDLFIAITGSGETQCIVHETKRAVEQECNVVAITSKPLSSIASLANMVLIVPGAREEKPKTGTTHLWMMCCLFEHSLHITLDALCIMVARRDGCTEEEMHAYFKM